MLDDYGIDSGMHVYSQQAEQMKYHTTVPIHKRGDELSPTQGLEPVNKKCTTATSIADLKGAQLELHWLQCEVEIAIDEHLELLRENKTLKEKNCEKNATEIETEYMHLSTENASLLADVTRKRKEIKACERIIQILQAEITQAIRSQSIVDLTKHPDY